MRRRRRVPAAQAQAVALLVTGIRRVVGDVLAPPANGALLDRDAAAPRREGVQDR